MSERDELDPVIHTVARLRITAVLAALGPADSLSFTRLQSLLDLTAGNLTTHLRKLDEAGYVETVRLGSGRNGATSIRLTCVGRRAFEDYSRSLRSLLDVTVEPTNAVDSSMPTT